MKFTAAIAGMFLAALGAIAQAVPAEAPAAQMSAPDVNQMCARVLQLMDAGGVAIPMLRVAVEPLINNVRSACRDLQLAPATGQPTYNVLQNLRAYLDLAEVVPKPFPFPEAARDQLREVRDAATRLDAHFRALLDQKDADLRSPDRDGALRFQQDNSVLPPPDPKGRRIVFLGDSIFSQWRLNEYFPGEDFINRSINGQLSGQLLTRMKADVIDLKPKVVVIEAGSFDLSRNVPIALIANNLTLLADIAQANGIQVVFAAVPPVSDYHKADNPTYERTPARAPQLIVALNDWVRAFAADRRLGYVDFHAALADPQGMLAAEVSDDGLHPNARGYRLMAPVLAAELERVLQVKAPARSTAPAKSPAGAKPNSGK